jgi:hypothetical protein
MSNDAQWEEVHRLLPHEGLKDYGAFLEAGAARLIDEIKAKRKAARSKQPQ